MTPSALHQAERALFLIVGECPATEPVYPPAGSSRLKYENWAFDSANWNAAQTARPALEAVRAELKSLESGV